MTNLQYHIDSYERQKGAALDGLLDLSLLDAKRILDVGCGAGQTLRRLQPRAPATLCGVDRDLAVLTFGAHEASQEGIALSLACASGTALPYADKTFDLVISRVALNYMRQREAVGEMARVLKPGGIFFCRVERVWYDLHEIAASPSLKALACRLRDLGWGLVHQVIGWQPLPGGSLRGGRVFASGWRLRRILAQAGCHVVTTAPSPDGPTCAGQRTQLTVVAKRRGVPDVA
jgi:SAM-dependent methyltransferase